MIMRNRIERKEWSAFCRLGEVLRHGVAHPFLLVLACAFATGCVGRKEAGEAPDLHLESLVEEAGKAAGDSPVFALPEVVPVLERHGVKRAGLEDGEIRGGVWDHGFWRMLDRRHRFGAVLLTGQPASVRILLRHLLDSEDWSVVALSPAGVVFARFPKSVWDAGLAVAEGGEADILAGRGDFGDAVRLVEWLMEAGYGQAAGQGLERLRGRVPERELLVLKGRLAADRNDWEEARAIARRILEDAPENPAALILQAHAQMAAENHREAWKTTRRLVALDSENGQYLFIHARAARAASAYADEVEALERLVELADQAGAPKGAYLGFLGQAYSAAGQPGKALEAFRNAMKDPTTPASQRGFIFKAIQRLEDGTH